MRELKTTLTFSLMGLGLTGGLILALMVTLP
ncbi:hypothetical protein AEYBE204_13655 [Asticcacaulis sp. YBE204]|nr:hypothetical protein AEYBE204_13655 [Asticcacaulis sp. YBE204]